MPQREKTRRPSGLPGGVTVLQDVPKHQVDRSAEGGDETGDDIWERKSAEARKKRIYSLCVKIKVICDPDFTVSNA